jgi:hypothetical protein
MNNIGLKSLQMFKHGATCQGVSNATESNKVVNVLNGRGS